MATDTINSGPDDITISSTDKQEILQQRYTELLEKRVAQLEALLAADSKRFLNVQTQSPESSGKPDSKGESKADIAVDNKSESKDTPPPPHDKSDATNGSNSIDKKESANIEKEDKTKEDTTDSKSKKEESNAKSKSRYRNVIREWNKKTGVHEDVDLGEAGKKKADDGDIAFTFRRVMNQETGLKDAYSEVDIEAVGLREMLKDIIGTDYPGQNLDGDIINMMAPFAPLVHNWAKLEEAATSEDDNPTKKQPREDLRRLLDSVKVAPELEKYFKTRDSNLDASITTYETYWTLFAPKTKVVAKVFLNTLQVLEVEVADWPWENPPPRTLNVLAWCWDWNGKEFTKVYYFLPIDKFQGTKPINQLGTKDNQINVYPLKYHKEGTKEDQEELCKMLQQRGAKYNKIVRSKPGATQMYAYNGDALSDRRSVIRSKESDSDNDNRSNNDEERGPSGSPDNHRKKVSIQGKFIVDPEAFLQYGAGSLILGDSEPAWVGDLNDRTDARRQAEGVEKEPTDEDFLLYPPRLLGYSTREKMWGQFGIDQTTNAPSKQTSMFRNQLQLDPQYKSMIQALVHEHEGRGEERVQVKDVVEDKGKGLVLLLHGPPGVGKTLTAELIAEATGKPLFVVSVAEIGLNASRAERNLEQMFYLAGKWEAVLLVDEADVFLEARTSLSDPNRNALVSVLLRVLEYYQGIMILTTNRITSLDIAVQSRIHLAIRYDDLTKTQKQNVFKNFLDQLKPDSIMNYDGMLDFINDFGTENKLNGRQIRNVMSAALSLARNQAEENNGDPRLQVKHLRQVLSITKDFQEQLDSITITQRVQNEAARSRR